MMNMIAAAAGMIIAAFFIFAVLMFIIRFFEDVGKY